MQTGLNSLINKGQLKIISVLVSAEIALDSLTFFIGTTPCIVTFFLSLNPSLVYDMNIFMSSLPIASNEVI